ncbi:MAG TPA: hypothetical protein VJ911_00360 [Cryomorphaceae bacterium]|nr:hypothetical protein [Cryomorphaceae bacterium]
MKKLVVSGFIENGDLKIRLNDLLIIDGSGDFESELSSNTDNMITWYVEGKPKSNFRITVSSPAESSFQVNKALGPKGKDSGIYTVQT